jgi:hypothetical protein
MGPTLSRSCPNRDELPATASVRARAPAAAAQVLKHCFMVTPCQCRRPEPGASFPHLARSRKAVTSKTQAYQSLFQSVNQSGLLVVAGHARVSVSSAPGAAAPFADRPNMALANGVMAIVIVAGVSLLWNAGT